MVALSFHRALLLAGAFAHLGAAQTADSPTILTQDGSLVVADESTVGPAAEAVTDLATDEDKVLLLTDAVVANLTALGLSDIDLFAFGDDAAGLAKRSKTARVGDCKVFPGDPQWPSRLTWTVFDVLSGGALIETVPISAVCYSNSGVYDAEKCQNVLGNWTKSALHVADPTSVMSPLYQGETCMPQKGDTGSTCALGGFPSYSVRIQDVYQVQLAVNFARNKGIRLVVHNTGHDFLGKSTGAGALSIWTHNLKDIKYFESYETPSYSGPALKLGAGVQVAELYAAANKHGVTAVGGECAGVGVAGGYTAGGGHSPLSTKYGLASDQVLSIDVVLPNGRFVTATETLNKDLFWALRGGGGATFGVVTSITVKAHPKMTFSGFTFNVVTGAGTKNTEQIFWDAMYAYWRRFPSFSAEGVYGYSMVFPRFDGVAGYTWAFNPFMFPGKTLAQSKALIQPLVDEWTALGFDFTPEWFEHDNFYDAWTRHFPTETVANSNMRTSSRLFPGDIWSNVTKRDAMFDTVKQIMKEGSALIQYNMNPAQRQGTPDSGANSHWRTAQWFAIMGTSWGPDATEVQLESSNRRLTDDWNGRMRPFGPGGYLNEGDVMEPDFQDAFYGSNYARLLKIKREVDPDDVFWAPTAVGSERWDVAGQRDWLTLQTGRLCKVRD